MATKEAPRRVSDTRASMRLLNLATQLATEIQETLGEGGEWYQANALARSIRDVLFAEHKHG